MTSEPPLRVHTIPSGETHRGPVVDLTGEKVAVDAVLAQLDPQMSTPDESPVRIDSVKPGRWWRPLADPAAASEATGDVDPVDSIVAAARSRGHALDALRAQAAAEYEASLLDEQTERVDLTSRRREVAETGADVERLRESVATIRGRLQARRAVGEETATAERDLREEMTRLSEAETDRLAAEQAYAAAERRARSDRSRRRRRLQLADRVRNREREAREALVRSVVDEFSQSVERLPGEAVLQLEPVRVVGDPVTARLAALRLASIRAPVVDATNRFTSAADAVEALGVPVIRCRRAVR